jgi:phenylacetic acid degradation operon negative regulatory protein
MTSLTEYLSTIETAPLSYFVYSSLSAFAHRHNGELPGMWFISALGEVGRPEPAIRQTLYRMEQEHELVTRKEGRVKFYSPSPYAKAEIDAGTAKIFDSTRSDWDRKWTFVHLGLRGARFRSDRERIIAILNVEGFGHLGVDLFVHPRPDHDRLIASLPARVRRSVLIVRGSALEKSAERGLLDLWRVDGLAKRYQHTLDRLQKLERDLRKNSVKDREAFLLRFAVVFNYLGVAWDDPGLPREILPATWPGEEAQRLAGKLYKQLLPAATRFADDLMTGVVSRNSTGNTRAA